jgi:hypothetical protein
MFKLSLYATAQKYSSVNYSMSNENICKKTGSGLR